MATRHPRTPYDTEGGLVHFPRMLDKIRLHQRGELDAAYIENLGEGFDARCCAFLGVPYARVVELVKSGLGDAEVLEACRREGVSPTAEQVEIWNAFMMKRGWRDAATDRLLFRLREAGAEHRAGEIQTFFDYIDFDEGRPLRRT